MNAVTEMPSPLVFSDSAANKVRQLIDEEGNPELKLRVFVTGGGCSGFQYGFTFDEVKNEDDAVMEKNGVMLLIDPMSYQYLVGAEIDYQEGLEAPSSSSRTPMRRAPAVAGLRSPSRVFLLQLGEVAIGEQVEPRHQRARVILEPR